MDSIFQTSNNLDVQGFRDFWKCCNWASKPWSICFLLFEVQAKYPALSVQQYHKYSIAPRCQASFFGNMFALIGFTGALCISRVQRFPKLPPSYFLRFYSTRSETPNCFLPNREVLFKISEIYLSSLRSHTFQQINMLWFRKVEICKKYSFTHDFGNVLYC